MPPFPRAIGKPAVLPITHRYWYRQYHHSAKSKTSVYRGAVIGACNLDHKKKFKGSTAAVLSG
jgi:hypothetical protein